MRYQFCTAPLLFITLYFTLPSVAHAQVGLSVSPPRVFYSLDAGETGSEKVLISNVSKEHSLHLSLTFGDWKYDPYGNDLMFPDSLDNSCSNWLTVPEGFYLTLNGRAERLTDNDGSRRG